MSQQTRNKLSDIIVLMVALALSASTCGLALAYEGESGSGSSPTPTAMPKTYSDSIKTTSNTTSSPSTEIKDSSGRIGSLKTGTINSLSINGDSSRSISIKASDLSKHMLEAKEKRDEKLTENKTEFEQKIAGIKDETKQRIASNVATAFNKINDTRTANDLKRVDRLIKILTKIETRSNRAKTTGVDVTTLLARINVLKTKLTDEQTKITAQQAKAYTVQIQSESTLGKDFSTTLTQLKSDLSAERNDIKALKKELEDVFALFKTTVKTDTEAETSAEPTITATTPSSTVAPITTP